MAQGRLYLGLHHAQLRAHVVALASEIDARHAARAGNDGHGL